MNLIFIITLALAFPLVVSQDTGAKSKVVFGIDEKGHLIDSGEERAKAASEYKAPTAAGDPEALMHKDSRPPLTASSSKDSKLQVSTSTSDGSHLQAASEFKAPTAGHKGGGPEALMRKESRPPLSASGSKDSELQVAPDDYQKADGSQEGRDGPKNQDNPTEEALIESGGGEDLSQSDVLDELEAMMASNREKAQSGWGSNHRRRRGNNHRRRSGGSKVDCVWSEWTSDGKCSATCGGGIEIFTKVETSSRSDNLIAHGGKDCQGPDAKEGTCNKSPCPTTTMALPLQAGAMCMCDLTLRFWVILIMSWLVSN